MQVKASICTHDECVLYEKEGERGRGKGERIRNIELFKINPYFISIPFPNHRQVQIAHHAAAFRGKLKSENGRSGKYATHCRTFTLSPSYS